MTSRSVIDLNINDDLYTVIKKCNSNFKLIIGQQSKQDQINGIDSSQFERELADAVDSLTGEINGEANTRRQADETLAGSISTVDAKFNNYTKTSDLVGVVLEWTRVLDRDTTSDTNFVGMQVDLTNYTEVVVTDKVDQKFMIKLAMPTADWVTYTLAGDHQFRVKLESNTMRISLGTGATWFVYAR